MDLSTALAGVSGVGYSFAKRLSYLNLLTVEDLIFHFPFRYDDFSNVSSAIEAKIGEKVTLVGEIWSIKNIYTRSRKVMTQAVFNDGTTPIELTWFNQSWLTKQIQVGDRLQVSGKLSKYKNKFTIVAPVWEKISNVGKGDGGDGREKKTNLEISLRQSRIEMTKWGGSGGGQKGLHTGRLVPVYPETFGLTSKWLRTKISQILPRVKSQIVDPLPEVVRESMLPLDEAVEKIHFPNTLEDVVKARDRLGFDELFFIQLATQKIRAEWKDKPAIKKFPISNYKLQITNFIEGLPFGLTGAQMRVIEEILVDLQSGQPMNRLVQGEVGSGKTVVAAVIAYITYLNGFKTLFMAPTEILAFQHYSTLSRLLEPFGIEVGIYTGSKKYNKVTKVTKGSKVTKVKKHSSPDVIVGTHALISEKLYPENVGLVIVDEQQRFGVEQRTIIRAKAKVPHFLAMTATPIPRTVALTMYGDLDLSVIDELPKGRIPVKTFVVPAKKRDDAYKFIERKVKIDGDQVYIVTPLIEFSESFASAKAAKVEFERLKKDIFPDLRLGLLHGRLKSKEKEEVLNDFKDHKIDILVSTSVVEVGVDVGNATVMVIEGADRFGLSQLHQLRGRVGRGTKESFCFLFPMNDEAQAISRLKNLERTSDGLKLAELDLKIRGSGEIFGTRQSGRFELKIASLHDLSLIEKTREKAKQILAQDPRLENYPQLRLKLGPGVMPD